MTPKRIVEFKLDDGSPVFMEIDDQEETYGMQRVSLNTRGIVEAQQRFTDAIARLKPAAQLVLNSFRDMNEPDEITLEFGVKFHAEAGAVLASVESDATFKVSLAWEKIPAIRHITRLTGAAQLDIP